MSKNNFKELLRSNWTPYMYMLHPFIIIFQLKIMLPGNPQWDWDWEADLEDIVKVAEKMPTLLPNSTVSNLCTSNNNYLFANYKFKCTYALKFSTIVRILQIISTMEHVFYHGSGTGTMSPSGIFILRGAGTGTKGQRTVTSISYNIPH